MAYLASDLFSGTWENIYGPTASWQSNQNTAMRGFTAFVDGYGEENNGASISYEGSNYYEWGYVFKDTDLDGSLEISQSLASIFGNRSDLTYVSEGYDEVVGRYYSLTASTDRPSNGGTWDRNPEKYNGTFTGSDLGIFEIDVELDFTPTDNNDLIMGSTNNDLISGNGGDDFLMSRSGNDTIEGGLGNDTIDGGYGSDTAVFNYNFSDYTIAQSNSSSKYSYKSSSNSTSNSFTVSSNSEGTDTLTGIELAKFADKTIGIDYSNPISGHNYLLTNIKDYGGTLHGGSESEQEINYYYQGSLDVAGDGTIEDIYTNKISKRWATVRRDSSTNNVDWSDHGKGGGTRIVGIYIDPLVTSGDVIQFSDHDSQYRFQNDLGLNNLLAKTTGDYDSNGIQEVYWKTADGTAYLRSLMHDDGNIRYANYQSEEQMSNYLTTNGYESAISDIVS